MLKHLSIRNYALIDRLDIDFDSGLSMITGETGAGKSILLGALSLILGQRADSHSLYDTEQKCIIEGHFDVSDYGLQDFFKNNDLDYAASTIIRREISPSGNSRAFINDTPVNLQQLKSFGLYLVDIHSQHETLLLNSSDFQLFFVDSFSGQLDAVTRFRNGFRELTTMKAELEALIVKDSKARLDRDFFQYQFDELEKQHLKEGEQEAMESDLELQNNAEIIKKNVFESINALQGGNKSVLSVLAEIKKLISDAEKFHIGIRDLGNRLQSVLIELKDIADELDKVQEDISYNPDKIQEIEKRLNVIYSLQHKHRVNSVSRLIEIKEEIRNKLTEIENLDQNIANYKNSITEKENDLRELAGKISALRGKSLPRIEKQINVYLKELGMPHAKIEIMNERQKDITVNGIDLIGFYFSANKGSEPKEIHKVASGGELSRLMLSIKSILAQYSSLPTIIFDEIDTGVSGEIADKVGNMMKKMSQERQVISVTHLPQIASKGKHHYFVFKESRKGMTKTSLRRLNEEERIKEVARMLSGEELTSAAIENAKVLLKA